MDQNQIMQIQIMEQEANQLNQQLQLIDQHLSEMQKLELSLEELDKTQHKEILVDIGKRIYLPVEIKNKKLTVEVGKGKFVQKTIPKTNEIIANQLQKLSNVKEQILGQLEELQTEMNNLMLKLQNEMKK